MKTSLAWFIVVFACGIWSCAGTHQRLKPPRLHSEMKLDYPLAAQMDHIEGAVDLGVFVSHTGLPLEVKLLKSSGYSVLDTAALAFTRKVNFEPAEVDGKNISAWTRLVLRYRLTEVPFDRSRWVGDVKHLQKQATAEADGSAQEGIYRSLYTQYVGLINYADSRPDPSLNDLIRKVIDPSTEAYWQPFFKNYIAVFALWDDFLRRYANSSLAERVKEDLMDSLAEPKRRLQQEATKSDSKAETAAVLLERMDHRLQQLQGR